MGHIRDGTVHQQQGRKMYLDCYSALGGFHGSGLLYKLKLYPNSMTHTNSILNGGRNER